MFSVVLSSLLPFQEPAPPTETPKPTAQPAVASQAKPVARPAVAWDDVQAKAAVAAFQKAMKGSPSMSEKNQALEALAEGSNKLLVAPLAEVVEKDKSIVIRKRAAELIGNQPADKANPLIRKLLKSPRVDSQPAVAAELVRALARCSYETAQWSDLEDAFESSYHAERVPLQEALLELIATHKEKKAIPLLLRNLDEPVPENVDARENPPAEYWEARWKAWKAWRTKVKDALFAITGQTFSTAEEARAWLKKNPIK
jgi:HEAT repeat protein